MDVYMAHSVFPPPAPPRTLVHVSTAFVHGSKAGSPSTPLPEELPDLGGRDPELLYNSLRNSSSARAASGCSRTGKGAAAAMADLGYPNSYTFTKALGEHLLVRALGEHNRRLRTRQVLVSTACGMGVGDEEETVREGGLEEKEGCRGDAETMATAETVCMPPREASQLKLRLIRPSIVGPSWIFPWPGWTGEQPSTVTGKFVVGQKRDFVAGNSGFWFTGFPRESVDPSVSAPGLVGPSPRLTAAIYVAAIVQESKSIVWFSSGR